MLRLRLAISAIEAEAPDECWYVIDHVTGHCEEPSGDEAISKLEAALPERTRNDGMQETTAATTEGGKRE